MLCYTTIEVFIPNIVHQDFTSNLNNNTRFLNLKTLISMQPKLEQSLLILAQNRNLE